MRHGPFVRGIIHLAQMIAGYPTGHDSHVQPRSYAGEEPVLRIEPGEPGGIVEEKMRLAA